MARRSDHSRDELRAMAVAAARDIVQSSGIQGLTTRAVAQRIGYTVGTLYVIFHNLDDLIFAVNAETLADLRERMEQAMADLEDPAARLKVMAQNYLDYALANPNLARLAFEHQSAAVLLPDVVTKETDALLSNVLVALRDLLPESTQAEIQTIAASFWSGIHGICHLALTDRLKIARAESVQAVLNWQVDVFLDGLEAVGS